MYRILMMAVLVMPMLGHAQSVVVAPDIFPTLINGTPVAPGSWVPVVRIVTGSSGCTATIVGKRALLSAAHCAGNGATSQFTVNGKQYSTKAYRSPLYPGQDHDVVLLVATEDIAVTPHVIGGKADVGADVTILGYGCTNVGGGGGNDGVLRIGTSKVKSFSGFDMVSSNPPQGAALCYGDSGGPLFDMRGAKPLLLGINSKGNIKDTNYNVRLDIPESTKFLNDMATQLSIEICGINAPCDGGPQPGTFTVENEAVKMVVTNKGKHLDDYLKKHIQYLMDFLVQ